MCTKCYEINVAHACCTRTNYATVTPIDEYKRRKRIPRWVFVPLLYICCKKIGIKLEFQHMTCVGKEVEGVAGAEFRTCKNVSITQLTGKRTCHYQKGMCGWGLERYDFILVATSVAFNCLGGRHVYLMYKWRLAIDKCNYVHTCTRRYMQRPYFHQKSDKCVSENLLLLYHLPAQTIWLFSQFIKNWCDQNFLENFICFFFISSSSRRIIGSYIFTPENRMFFRCKLTLKKDLVVGSHLK